jgi:hypothetical protein
MCLIIKRRINSAEWPVNPKKLLVPPDRNIGPGTIPLGATVFLVHALERTNLDGPVIEVRPVYNFGTIQTSAAAKA